MSVGHPFSRRSRKTGRKPAPAEKLRIMTIRNTKPDARMWFRMRGGRG